MQRAKLIAENKDLSKEQRSIGIMGALMGVSNDSLIKGMVTVANTDSSKKASAKAKKPRRPRGMTETQSAIYDMLMEDCGTHMMDSGGDEGRQWQRNRKVTDFRDLLPINYEYEDRYGLTIHRLLFHWLDEWLEYDHGETKKLMRWIRKNDQYSNSPTAIEDYIMEVYERSEDDLRTGNTYNDETMISQDFAYTYFTDDENNCKLFISVHGGADIRGGYSNYKVFDLTDECFWLMNDAHMSCSCGGVYTDDSYHWYNDDGNWDDTCGSGLRTEGIPTCWKGTGDKKLRCTECDEIVGIS